MSTLDICIPLTHSVDASFVEATFNKLYGANCVQKVTIFPNELPDKCTIFIKMLCLTEEALSLCRHMNEGNTAYVDYDTTKWRCVKARSPSTYCKQSQTLVWSYRQTQDMEQANKKHEKEKLEYEKLDLEEQQRTEALWNFEKSQREENKHEEARGAYNEHIVQLIDKLERIKELLHEARNLASQYNEETNKDTSCNYVLTHESQYWIKNHSLTLLSSIYSALEISDNTSNLFKEAPFKFCAIK